jgi:hypothetical protein
VTYEDYDRCHQHDLIRDGIRESSQPSRTFWLMNALAIEVF